MRAGGRRRRVVVSACAALACVIALGSGAVTPTLASWTDRESTTARLTAGTMTTPAVAACAAENDAPLGAFSGLRMTWTSPMAEVEHMRLELAPSGAQPVAAPTSGITRDGPVNGLYTYTASYKAEELAALLGALPGAAVDVRLSARAGDHWRSPSEEGRTLNIGRVGDALGSGRCDRTHALALSGLDASTPLQNRTVPVGTPATSSLPAALADRRRTPEYAARLTRADGGAAEAGGRVVIVLPEGLTFFDGPGAGGRESSRISDSSGWVRFRVTANGSRPVQGPIVVRADGADQVVSALPVISAPLVAWGWNDQGQTGANEGRPTRSAAPLWDAPSITGARALGGSYSALLYADQRGDLWGRGYNQSGAIGDGTTTSRTSAVAATVSGGAQLGGIVHIGRGTEQAASVAVDDEGGVWATGIAESGGFGAGYVNTARWQRISDRFAPTVTAVSAELNPWGNVIAVLSNGRVLVSGADSYGYAAQGRTVTAAQGQAGLLMMTGANTPIEGAVSAGIGWEHSAVVTGDGKLYTAGTASYGGSGPSRYLVEKPLPAGKAAARVVVGEYKTLVLMTDGTVYAMGNNTGGALGTGSSANPGANLVPVALPAGSAVTDLAMGNDGALFLLRTGEVYFAGNDDTGGTGSGASSGTGIRHTPVRVPLAHTAVDVAATWYDTYLALLG